MIINNINMCFDIVIGNPPYITSAVMVKKHKIVYRDLLRDKYKLLLGNWDIYIAFFEQSFNFLDKIGVLVFITPDIWLSKSFGDKLREFSIKYLCKIIECSEDIFENVNINGLISVFVMSSTQELQNYKYSNKKLQFINRYNKDFILKVSSNVLIFSSYDKLLCKIMNYSNKLSDYGRCYSACSTSDAYKLKIFLRDIDIFSKEDYFKVVNTGTIGAFYVKFGLKEMRYINDRYRFPVVNRECFLQNFTGDYKEKTLSKKLIIKGLTLLECCVDLDCEFIAGKSTLVFLSNNEEDLLFVAAIINSDIAYFQLYELYRFSTYNFGVVFTKDMINNICIPVINLKDKETIILMGRDIITYLKENKLSIVRDLKNNLNEFLYSLYGLREQERTIIRSYKSRRYV